MRESEDAGLSANDDPERVRFAWLPVQVFDIRAGQPFVHRTRKIWLRRVHEMWARWAWPPQWVAYERHQWKAQEKSHA